MKAAIYARVSTDEQELQQQIQACGDYCKMRRWPNVLFTEKQSSAKVRPVWDEVLKRARQGQFSVIVVFRLDRAWRSSRQFIMDFDSLQSRGIYVVSVMESLDATTPIGKAMMTILVALAELERMNISEATKHRLQALRNLGKTLGRPKGSRDSKPRRNVGYLIREARKRRDPGTSEGLAEVGKYINPEALRKRGE